MQLRNPQLMLIGRKEVIILMHLAAEQRIKYILFCYEKRRL